MGDSTNNAKARKLFLSFASRTPTGIMLLYIGAALLSFLILVGWLAVDPELLHRPFAQGLRLFGVIHLISLGWITMMMIGVYYNLIPVILHPARVYPILGLILFFFYAPGVGMFVWGFSFASRLLIGLGASLLAIALIAHGVQFGWTTILRLHNDELLPVSLGFSLAFLFLIETAAIGLLMSLTVAGILSSATLTLLPLHMIAALGGWLGMTIMGAAYRLVPLFFDVFPKDYRPSWNAATIALTAVGIVFMQLIFMIPALRSLLAVAAFITAGGALLYMADVVRMIRAAKKVRQSPVKVLTQAAIAHIMLAVVLFACVQMRIIPSSQQIVAWAGYLGLFVGPSLLIFGQLSRILVFLTGLDLAQRAREQNMLPKKLEYLNPSLLYWGFGVFQAGVVLNTPAMLGETMVAALRLGVWLQAIGGLAMVCAFYRSFMYRWLPIEQWARKRPVKPK